MTSVSWPLCEQRYMAILKQRMRRSGAYSEIPTGYGERDGSGTSARAHPSLSLRRDSSVRTELAQQKVMLRWTG